MNKSVLISIRPEWCEKIASGQKTIEVRKTRPKINTPFKSYIYCTKPKDYISEASLYLDELYRLPSGEIKYGTSIELSCFSDQWNTDNFLNGKVICEFTCNHIELIQANHDIVKPFFFTEIPYIDFFNKSQLTEFELLDYIGDHDGYGWHISDLVVYDKPKLLHNFYRYCKKDVSYTDLCLCCKKNKQGVCKNFLTRPPQSWCYVEEL